MKRIVIVHPEQGIYLGSCLGMGFWSLLDAAGQTHAATFETEQQAREYVTTWENPNGERYANLDDYRYVAVETMEDEFASIPELERAGLADKIGEMERV